MKIVSKKTQTPCTGSSLALRSTSEKDLFPSATLKEISAMKDAGLLLISMSVHRNEKLLLQVIFFISKCSIYSCQIPHLHPAFWPSSAFTGPNQEENNQYFSAIQYVLEFLYPLLSSHFIAAGSDCFSFNISPLDLITSYTTAHLPLDISSFS